MAYLAYKQRKTDLEGKNDSETYFLKTINRRMGVESHETYIVGGPGKYIANSEKTIETPVPEVFFPFEKNVSALLNYGYGLQNISAPSFGELVSSYKAIGKEAYDKVMEGVQRDARKLNEGEISRRSLSRMEELEFKGMGEENIKRKILEEMDFPKIHLLGLDRTYRWNDETGIYINSPLSEELMDTLYRKILDVHTVFQEALV